MEATTEKDWVSEVGKPAYASIAEMVAALGCDYDRLEELKDERDSFETADYDGKSWEQIKSDDADELAELLAAAGGCADREHAEQRIQEDALSVEVRSGWVIRGENMVAEEFNILLTTGGPAVRILGELDEHGEPRRAWLEVQDWGKAWTEYFPGTGSQDVLLTYARCFYFGE